MAEMIVRLEWDEDELGIAWMNKDNLLQLLHTKAAVGSYNLSAEVIYHSCGDQYVGAYQRGYTQGYTQRRFTSGSMPIK
jgi:hypothetical protein